MAGGRVESLLGRTRRVHTASFLEINGMESDGLVKCVIDGCKARVSKSAGSCVICRYSLGPRYLRKFVNMCAVAHDSGDQFKFKRAIRRCRREVEKALRSVALN